MSTLVDAILAFLSRRDLLDETDVRRALEREIETAGPDAVATLERRLAEDHGWNHYAPDPLARRIHHLLADRFLDPTSRLGGEEHLSAVADGPLVIFANHLSYADANAIEVLIRRSGCSPLADRLTAVAGPKVFSSRERRFSSLCFGTIKVPQSADVASGEAALSPRAVARAARCAIEIARSRLRAGDALLLFAEGTRSRSVRMQPMLPAVARYLEEPGTWILPMALTGTEALFAVDDATLRPARVVVQAGQRIRADDLRRAACGDRRAMMDAIGLAIAELLPADYRGVYADASAWTAAGHALRSSRTVV